jgi:hypothetical protein
MMTAHFDESDTDGAAVVAGFVAEAKQWVHFSREWKALLSEHSLQCFHMKNFAHSKKEFEGWNDDEPKRQRFIQRAVGIIKRRVRVPIGVIIDRDLYENFVSTPARKVAFGNHYTTASYLCLLLTGAWAEYTSHRESVAYVFDRGNRHRTEFEEAFNKSKDVPELVQRYRLGSLSFEDDRKLEPLQASDLIAYEMSKFWTDKKNTGKRLPRFPLEKLMELPCEYLMIADAELFNRMAADMRA